MALATAHQRDMRLVQLIAERVTVGDRRGHRDPRSLRVAISTASPRQDFGSYQAVYALPPGDPKDVSVQFIPDAAVTDGAALYETAFGKHEPKTDLCEATALKVIASVLGFVDDEIELVT